MTGFFQGIGRDAIADVCEHRADAAFVDEFTGLSGPARRPAVLGQPLRLISDPAMQTTLGVGSTTRGCPCCGFDPRRDRCSLAGRRVDEDPDALGLSIPAERRSMTSLLNAKRRERWLIATIGLFGFLLGLTLFAADRIRRQKNRIKKTEQAFRESEEKLRLMANNLNEMVLAYDMDRRIVFANPAVEKLTGYSIANLKDKGCISAVHPDDKARMLAHWDTLFQGPSMWRRNSDS